MTTAPTKTPAARREIRLSAAKAVTVDGPVPYETTADVYSPGGLPDTPAGLAIEEAGYVEEEYFLSGLGDIYSSGYPEPMPVLERSGIPYTTRVLVIRPRDPQLFNGVVHLTGMHPFLGGVQWNWASHMVLTSGAAYVAVGTGTDENGRSKSTIDFPVAGPWATRWFDSLRYAPLRWPEEDGIRWTVFSDAARLLRAEDRPFLADLKIERVYASGWSFLGSIQRTYINEGFHDLFRAEDGSPLIDGYCIGISSPWQKGGYLAINSDMAPAKIGDPRRTLRAIDVPVIEFLTEHEGRENNGPQVADADEGLGRHRLYELGGASHRDIGVEVPRTYRLQLEERGHPAAAPDVVTEFPPSDVPVQFMFAAVMENLHRWVTEGLVPPPSSQLEHDRAQYVARDEFGNPLGGVRSVQLDVPISRYGAPPERRGANVVPQYISMLRIPLDRAELDRLYPGGKADYMAKAAQAVEQMISERWLRPGDRDLYLRRISEAATERFADLAPIS